MKEEDHYLKVNVSSENKIKLMYTTFFLWFIIQISLDNLFLYNI